MCNKEFFEQCRDKHEIPITNPEVKPGHVTEEISLCGRFTLNSKETTTLIQDFVGMKIQVKAMSGYGFVLTKDHGTLFYHISSTHPPPLYNDIRFCWSMRSLKFNQTLGMRVAYNGVIVTDSRYQINKPFKVKVKSKLSLCSDATPNIVYDVNAWKRTLTDKEMIEFTARPPKVKLSGDMRIGQIHFWSLIDWERIRHYYTLVFDGENPCERSGQEILHQSHDIWKSQRVL